jgi:tetratricopeptide (TPR) repeat protein
MKKLSILHICLWGVLLLLFLQGCAVPPTTGTYIKDGVEYGKVKGAFRHRWWNYYERGLSFMEGEFYNEAISDFAQAIEQRFEDQRMARTYGMHFVDYFPHREMGLGYYLLGEYDAAQKQMELSLEHQTSAKARYYLDKIRKGLMERQGLEISLPRIMVDLPSDEIWTRDDPVIISGTAKDEQYVSGITLAGNKLFLESAEQTIEFKQELDLDQGKHIIHIAAENLLGGKSKETVIIHVDRQGPVITLGPYSPDVSARNIINGFLYDESGEISLSVEGVDVLVAKGEDVRFTAPVKPGATSLTLIAKDKLGNETKAEVDLEGLAVVEKALHNYFIRYSGLDPGFCPTQCLESRNYLKILDSGFRRNDRIAFFEPLYECPIDRYPLLAWRNFGDVMSDVGGFQLAFSFGSQDDQGPVITLRGWADEQTVFLEKVYIEGEVRDESDIVSLTINDRTVPSREGRIIFFNQLVALDEGKNVVHIRTEDEEGNISEKGITIIRQVPKVFQLGSRFSMTLIPFEDKALTPGLSDMYDNLLLAKLMDQDRFRLIEREYLERILQEQKISRTDLADRETALKVGRLVAAQATLVGDFVETRTGIEIISRLIDNETSEILAQEDVYGESKDRAALQILAEGMAVKYHREFPLVDGIIVQKKGDSFFTDLGQGKTKPQRRLILYREGEPILHPVTGKLLGCDTEIIGYGRVTQVMEEMSQAELLEGLKDKNIKIKDKVMTQ